MLEALLGFSEPRQIARTVFPLFLQPDSPCVPGVFALIIHDSSINGARSPFSVCVANSTTALYINFIYIRSYTMIFQYT